MNYIIAESGQGRLLPTDKVAHLFQGLCLGVEYLHAKGLIHRDIKPENCLLSGDCTVAKISDFGLTRVTDSLDLVKTICGTPHYFAPELVNADLTKREKGWELGSMADTPYTIAVDVWALGCVLYIMLSSAPPFSDENLFEHIRTGNYTLDSEEFGSRPRTSVKLVQAMMTVDVSERLTIGQVLESEWLKSYKFQRTAVPKSPLAVKNRGPAVKRTPGSADTTASKRRHVQSVKEGPNPTELKVTGQEKVTRRRNKK